jgi:DNA-binding LacI/PurR family transcriptional regulator
VSSLSRAGTAGRTIPEVVSTDTHDTPVARRTTLRDVASAAGVSVSAVSLVLNGKSGVSAERRRRVLDAVEALNYTHAARPTPGKRTAVLGLLMENLSASASSDGFIAEIVSGVEEAARDAGFQMLLHLYRPGADPIGDIRALMGRDVDGLLVANGGDIGEDVIDGVLQTHVPVVLVENYVAAPSHAVVADNVTAGLLATRHLIGLGHHRIGLLAGSPRYVSLLDRRRGHLAAMEEAGLPVDPALMPPQAPGHPKKGYAQMQRLLSLPEPPTAVYAVSDKSAMGALDAVREAGLRVPDDISIVGTDDVAESAYTSPPLTTFHVPKRAMGQAAVAMLQHLLGEERPPPSRLVLQGRIVERGSAGPPPQG